MKQEIIDKALYDKYIEPTKAKNKRYVGIEIEMPVVNLNKEPVKTEAVLDMSLEFQKKFSFDVCGEDDYGNVNSIVSPLTGDNLSFDCSYANLELSMGKGSDIHELKARFDKYYRFINEFFKKYHYTLTGMGINPYLKYNDNQPVPNERYRMLYHHLHTYQKYDFKSNASKVLFHHYPEFGTYTSASQVQTDVYYDELITVINAFRKLEPFKVLLFANSLHPDEPDYLCSRNMLWEHSMQGFNPHNIGMFDDDLRDISELLEYIKTTSIYCTMRDGKYINFKPTIINDYLKLDKMTGEYFDGNEYREIEFQPCMEDLDYLRTFKFEDLTFRGTIEFRSMCCQPISDSMSVAAFHMGLIDNAGELEEMLSSDTVLYAHGYNATELQKLLSMTKFPEFIDQKELKKALMRILNLAEKGLKRRGFGEEEFLKPLYDRADKLSSPARKMVDEMKNGEKTIEEFIELYS